MKLQKFTLIPLIIVIILVIFFLATSKDETKPEKNSNASSANNYVSPTLTPTTFKVLGAETQKKNSAEDTSLCGLVTTEDELKGITGKTFKKQNMDLTDGKSLDCKYVNGSLIIEFYMILSGGDQFNKIKESSLNKISAEDTGFDAFFTKDGSNWNFYLLDGEKFISGTMPMIKNDSDTQDKLKEITTRMLIRD